jgi:predicted phosphoribosyltransferase
MFQDRADAALQLAAAFQGRKLSDPLVLGIPHGGAVTAAVLAEAISAEMDIVLLPGLRTPRARDVPLAWVPEARDICFSRADCQLTGMSDEKVHRLSQRTINEIAPRRELFRSVRPAAQISGRTVIVADEGIATGVTMVAALQAVRAENPAELLVATPVALHYGLRAVSAWCDEAICLLTPRFFYSVGQYYEDFPQVTDKELVCILSKSLRTAIPLTQ